MTSKKLEPVNSPAARPLIDPQTDSLVGATDPRTASVIDALPAQEHGKTRFVNFHFYGSPDALAALGKAIRETRQDALPEIAEDHLRVLEAVRLDKTALAEVDALMAGHADDYGVDYDGYEVMVAKSGTEQRIPPFSKSFRPGDAFAFVVPDGRWAYGLFVGGNAREGHLFRFFRLLDPRDRSPNAARLKGATDLYRQPVPGAIDPCAVVPLGRAPKDVIAATPATVPFRMREGWVDEDEVAGLARAAGLDPDSGDDWWPELLARLAAQGRTLRSGERWISLICRIGARGSLLWDEEVRLPPDAAMPDGVEFGTFARLEWVEATLTGQGHDLFELQDAVLR